MVRRAIAVGAGFLLLLLLVLGIRGCLNARKEQAYKDYVLKIGALVEESEQQSADLFELLRGDSPGDQGAVDLETRLNSFRVPARQLVDRAKDTDHPGELSEAHRFLIDALEFRSDGIEAVANLLPRALGDEGRSEAAGRIAAEMQRFLVSDVLYSQRVVPELRRELDREELGQDEVQVRTGEDTQFLEHIDWLRTRTVANRVRSIQGGGGGAADDEVAPGLHGTGLGTVTVQPGGKALTAGAAVDLPLSDELTFEVQVANQGDNAERDVVVRLSIKGPGRPIERERSLPEIQPGETETVEIPLAGRPATGAAVDIEVEIEAVPGEEKTDNNKGSFRAVFTRG